MPPIRSQTVCRLAAWAWAIGAPATVSGQVDSGPPDTGTPDLPVVEHVLANGMRFLLLPRSGAPIVSFALDVTVGSLDDPSGQKGVSHLLEHLLFKGTTSIGTRDHESEIALFRAMDAAHDSLVSSDYPTLRDRLRERIAALEDSARAFAVPDELDAIYTRNGARGLNATTGYHETRFTVSLPANRLELWFALESDRFRNPVFRDFYSERRVVLEERRQRLEAVPGATLRAAALATAFPEHGYGVPPLGYREDLETIARSDVERFYRAHYRPDQMSAAIVGEFDPDQVVEWAERYFGPLETLRVDTPPAPLAVPRPQDGERRVDVTFETLPQLQVAWKIPPATHPDTPALLVLTNLLVGSADARLTRALVSDDGPAASVVADLGPASDHPRLFTIQASPRATSSPEDIETAIYREIDRLILEPPTDDEIERVRTRLEAAEARSLVSMDGLAAELLTSARLRGDWREIFAVQRGMRSVDGDEVIAVVERYLRPEGRTVASLTDGSGRAEP